MPAVDYCFCANAVVKWWIPLVASRSSDVLVGSIPSIIVNQFGHPVPPSLHCHLLAAIVKFRGRP